MPSTQQRGATALRAHLKHSMYLQTAYNEKALVVLLQLARFVLCSFGGKSLRLLVNSVNRPGFAVAHSSRPRRDRCRIGIL